MATIISDFRRIRRLHRAELPLGTVALARDLIGKTLVRDLPGGRPRSYSQRNRDGVRTYAGGRRIIGRIVETEAYLPGDAAAHAFRGLTPRNRSMFLERGHAYVYFIYGNWYALNVSSERAGRGAAVLIRALEPLSGIEKMRRRRPGSAVVDLARGPGRLATALRIDRRYDGINLCARGPLWLGTPVRPAGSIGRSVRIGISKETHRLLRFYERGNPCVSGPKRLR